MDPRRAIAYLKPHVTGSGAADLTLSEADAPVLREFCEGLLVAYVQDRGDVLEFVSGRDLQAAGISGEELHRHAVVNLATALQEGGLQVQPYGAIFAVIAGGNFEASTMALPSLWEQSFRPFVEGDYLAAAPARDVLAFGQADDPAVEQALRELVGRLWPDQGAHLLSDRLYRWSGDWTLA